MPEFDTGVPHIARSYDSWLGGQDNFAADRDAAENTHEAAEQVAPGCNSAPTAMWGCVARKP